MKTIIGDLTVVDAITVTMIEGETVEMHPFDDLVVVIINCFRDDSIEGAVWRSNWSEPNIVKLDFCNHHKQIGGSAMQDIDLGKIGEKRLCMRYSYASFSTATTQTFQYTFTFGTKKEVTPTAVSALAN